MRRDAAMGDQAEKAKTVRMRDKLVGEHED
jgi:hypothetical protein